MLDTETLSTAGDSSEVSITPRLSREQLLPPKVHDLGQDSLSPGDDQHRSYSEVRDEAAWEEQVAALVEALPQERAHQSEKSTLHQSNLGVESTVQLEKVQSQPAPMVHALEAEGRAGDSNSSRPDREAQATGEGRSYVQAVSAHESKASGRVKVWTRESAAHQQSTHVSHETANPLYILAAITLGIPAVILILLVGMNPGMQDGASMSLVTLLVLAAALIAALFEIKRLVDYPSDPDHS